MNETEESRLYMSANGWRRAIGPDDPLIEAKAAAEYDRCHPDDSFADMKRRARFSKEDQGLLQDWLAAAAQAARAQPVPARRLAA